MSGAARVNVKTGGGPGVNGSSGVNSQHGRRRETETLRKEGGERAARAQVSRNCTRLDDPRGGGAVVYPPCSKLLQVASIYS
jgi:hypothetical protein